jgi:V/A-type H+-transporting ATPase subunit B
MIHGLLRYTRVLSIVGDILTIRAEGVAFGELALVENRLGEESLAQVIRLDGDQVSLQVFAGGRGISTGARTRFLGHSVRVPVTDHVLGRVFDGSGRPIDGGPSLAGQRHELVESPAVNPTTRGLPQNLIRTDVPMIDVFNALVESQKIPIFSVAGEPYNQLLARIGVQADADIVVFGGLGLIFDDFYFFRRQFEDAGIFARTVMFVNLARRPGRRALLVRTWRWRWPRSSRSRRASAGAGAADRHDRLRRCDEGGRHRDGGRAVEPRLHGRPLLADGPPLREGGRLPRGGSVTILTVTTMPGGDVTHPVPDNTGYITEGQFYLHDGVIDPFGSLSRLKQHVIGKVTREDHSQVMNTMIRFYSGAKDAEQKQAMAFELSDSIRSCCASARCFASASWTSTREPAAGAGPGPLLADHGRVLRARGAADEAGSTLSSTTATLELPREGVDPGGEAEHQVDRDSPRGPRPGGGRALQDHEGEAAAVGVRRAGGRLTGERWRSSLCRR